jgi:hypothetical protein
VFTARYGLSPYIKQTRLVFITEVESVYSVVRTDSLYKAHTFSFYNRSGKCSQLGTD